jgi:ribosomal protein L11 methyltransferase
VGAGRPSPEPPLDAEPPLNAEPPLDAEPPPPDDDGTSGEGAWVEFAVEADLEAVEAVSEILGRFAPGGTSVEPGFVLLEDGLTATGDPTRPAVVRAYLPGRDARAVRTAIAGARTALGHLQAFGLRPIGDLATRVVHEADWAQAWKAFFPVLHIGRRVVIRPTWRRHRRALGEIVLALDPGMAFGTGLHPTTRLCLAALEGLADAGRLARGSARDGSARVLDVGIGSGILAIAAGLFGAGELVGVDPDPIAVAASAANARRNRLAGRLNVRTGSLPSGAGPFDVVLANLIASLLVALAPQLRDELSTGGTLLASGIFVDREPEVREAFAAAGLRVVDRSFEAEWVALTAVRDAKPDATSG